MNKTDTTIDWEQKYSLLRSRIVQILIKHGYGAISFDQGLKRLEKQTGGVNDGD